MKWKGQAGNGSDERFFIKDYREQCLKTLFSVALNKEAVLGSPFFPTV